MFKNSIVQTISFSNTVEKHKAAVDKELAALVAEGHTPKSIAFTIGPTGSFITQILYQETRSGIL